MKTCEICGAIYPDYYVVCQNSVCNKQMLIAMGRHSKEDFEIDSHVSGFVDEPITVLCESSEISGISDE